jgi:hypothetical protein
METKIQCQSYSILLWCEEETPHGLQSAMPNAQINNWTPKHKGGKGETECQADAKMSGFNGEAEQDIYHKVPENRTKTPSSIYASLRSTFPFHMLPSTTPVA